VLEREWLDGGNLIRPKTKIFQDNKFFRKQVIFENWQIRRRENQAIQVRELFRDLFWDEVDFGRFIQPNSSCFRFLGIWASEGMELGLIGSGQVNSV
jgi:hypothetical protein